MFLYYQILIYQGFIALRKYFAELVLILEMMLPGQHLPCIQDPLRAVKDFKMRFFITLTEEQVLETVKDLVNTAAEHWKTTQYDYFQKTSNSIL
jgi:phosphatidylinositol kinase/protein kinase (PI-3  family)